MHKATLLLTFTLFAVACAGEPETVSIRLVDGFQSTMVQGSPPAVEPERTEWRFDGDGTIPAAEDDAETFGWTALTALGAGVIIRQGLPAKQGKELDRPRLSPTAGAS